MKHTLRHPFGGSRHYLRPERERRVRRKPPRQPKIHQSRLSVGSMLDAPDSSASRPGLRLRIVGLVIVGLFALLGLRLWTLQVLQAPAAVQAVAANQIRAVSIAPTRGEILDRTGIPLVDNTAVEEITLSQVEAQTNPAVIGRLAALIGETTAQVEASVNDKANSPFEPVPILADAPLADVLYLKEHPSEFPGVTATETTQRNYPQLETGAAAKNGAYPAAQVLGYVGSISADELASSQYKGYQAGDQVGQSGLEAQYEPELRGTPGQQQLEVDAQGNVAGTLKTTPAVAGDNLVTNLDLGLQQEVDDDLATQIAIDRKTPDTEDGGQLPPAINGAVVVMNPNNGAVLAMSSFPSYNPSIWTGGISDANYAAITASGAQNNYAIDAQLAPGSTFKLATATSALQTGLITPTYSFDDTGRFSPLDCTGPDCTLSDDKGDKPAGYINVEQALTVSSDTFFYNIGAMYWQAYKSNGQYGEQPIEDTAAQYGFGQPTGIDLPNEAVGRVDSPSERLKLYKESPTGFPDYQWYTGDNMEMAFGQGATIVTPLEEAVAYSTFANGGTRYAPELAAGVLSPAGRLLATVAPKVTGHVAISPTTYSALLAGFEGVIDDPSGTGYDDFVGDTSNPWNQNGFELAGKTGTASVNNDEPTSWFAGFGPNPNPQYVVVCMIDQGGYGAAASAQVVRNIFDYLRANPVPAVDLAPAAATVHSTQAAQVAGTTTTSTTP